jgi:pectate lyase
MHRLFILAILSLALLHALPANAQNAPIGWAAIPGHDLPTTTGGAAGKVVTAHTAQELIDYAKSDEPLTILVEGPIDGKTVQPDGMYKLVIASNKTLLGTGAGATITGLEFNLQRVSNIIIRNFDISQSIDGVALRWSHHVWIDHVAVHKCGDGAIDVTHRSDNVTISWCHLFDHNKTMLINSGANQPSDRGWLNTTVHHTWFNGSIQRNPRVGYGMVQVFNCLYDGEMSYGLGLHSQALVRLERNYFDHTKNPIKQMYRPDPASEHHGFAESIDNIYNETSGDQNDEAKSFPVNDYYLYDFALSPVAEVPTLVKSGAGPQKGAGEITPLPTPGNGAIKVDEKTKLKWTKGPEATTYVVALAEESGKSDPPPTVTTTADLTYTPTSLKPGTIYLWRIDQVTPAGTIQGETWRFRTAPAVNGDSPAP